MFVFIKKSSGLMSFRLGLLVDKQSKDACNCAENIFTTQYNQLFSDYPRTWSTPRSQYPFFSTVRCDKRTGGYFSRRSWKNEG